MTSGIFASTTLAPRSLEAPGRAGAVATLGGTIWLVVVGGLASTRYSTGTAAVVAASSVACWALWLKYIKDHSFDVLDPVHVVTAILAIGFWTSLLVVPQELLPFADETGAMLLVAVGTACFLFGGIAARWWRLDRWLPVPRSLRRPLPSWYVRRLMAFWVLTVAVRVQFVLGRGYASAVAQPDEVGPLYNLVLTIGDLGPLLLYMIILLTGQLQKRRRTDVGFLLIALAVEATVGALAGWKASALPLILASLLVLRGRRTGRTVLVALFLALCCCMPAVMTGVDIYRASTSRAGPDRATLVAALRQGQERNIVEQARWAYQRVAYGGMLATVVGAVNEGIIGCDPGDTLWPGLLWFVPRALWPGKPVMSIGGWYATSVLGWTEGEAEAAVTVPGDLYLNFRLEGALLGLFVYGLILRSAYQYLVVRSGTLAGACVFLPILLAAALGFERNLSLIIARACQGAGLAFAAVLLMQVGRRVVRPPRFA